MQIVGKYLRQNQNVSKSTRASMSHLKISVLAQLPFSSFLINTSFSNTEMTLISQEGQQLGFGIFATYRTLIHYDNLQLYRRRSARHNPI